MMAEKRKLDKLDTTMALIYAMTKDTPTLRGPWVRTLLYIRQLIEKP